MLCGGDEAGPNKIGIDTKALTFIEHETEQHPVDKDSEDPDKPIDI